MSLLEHGIYRSLIDSYYLNEGGLLADDAKLMRTHSIRTADEQQAYKNVISDFFREDEGYYIHDKCDGVMGKIFDKSQKARESAQKRWEKNAKDKRTHSEGSANGMLPINPIPTTHIPKVKNKKKPAFAKPTPDKINQFAFEQKLNLEGYFDYYESNGWKVGKNAMRDWKAAARNWSKRQGQYNNSNQQKPDFNDNNTDWAVDALNGNSGIMGFE